MAKKFTLLFLFSVVFVGTITASKGKYDDEIISLTGFSARKLNLSIMYRLCKIRNPAQISRTTECINWFNTAITHCAEVFEVDSNRIPILHRMRNWFMPSLKTLLNFEKITDYKAETLTESDCKVLLSKLARDFIIRSPHYDLSTETVESVWALLCLAMSILTLVSLFLGVHRIYIQFMKPKFEEREKILKYFEECATEMGTARYRTLVAVNQLMQSALLEAKHLRIVKASN